MKPIGLTLKDVTYNPYTGRTSGELMIVHLCLNCGKISTNRIAGDDNTQSIVDLLCETSTINSEVYKRLCSLGFMLLTQHDEDKVLTSLFGYHCERAK